MANFEINLKKTGSEEVLEFIVTPELCRKFVKTYRTPTHLSVHADDLHLCSI